MPTLKCPHCGQVFTVDDTELSSLIKQIRDGEFEKELNSRVSELRVHLEKEHQLAMDAQEEKIKYMENEHKLAIGVQEDKIKNLENEHRIEMDAHEKQIRIATKEESEKLIENLKAELEQAKSDKLALQLQLNKGRAKILLDEKDKQIEFYKDLKARMSTKMVGETLEQHCETQFNQLRATAFKNAYFEKDNDSRSGSKGDYIYREYDESDVEIISIMFEMKNEMDETATKHKNADFFKELDKDRREKKCEYAVLVSLLESDSELYNGGIVDVSYRYEKMYVVRPQCFIPIITLLRNAALNALTYKQELALVRSQDIDVTNFEEKLVQFKEAFGRNYNLAHSHFEKAIEEIDRTISHLEKVKKELQGSDNQLRIANNKVEDISVKKLTKDNPTMKEKFEQVRRLPK